MADFSVLLLTAPPAGQAGDGGGAFTKVDGREALLRTAELFLNRANVKQILMAFNPEAIEEAKKKYGVHLGFSGVKLVSGGPKWIDQFSAAAEKIADDATHVIVHDAARPATPYSDIDAVMEAAEKHPAVALVAPLRNRLIEVDEGGGAMAYHPPGQFVQLLTPHAFSRAQFMELAKSRSEPHASQLHLVSGSGLNVRVGGSADAGLVKQMIAMLPRPKVKAPASPFEEAQW